MTPAHVSRAAAGSFGSAVVLGCVAVASTATARGPGAAAELLLSSVSVLSFSAVAVAIVRRQPGNRVGWIFSAASLLLMAAYAGSAYIDQGNDLNRTGATAAAWIGTWGWIAGIGLLGAFVGLLFPEGRPISRRWRPLLWVGGISLALGLVGVALGSGPIDTGYPENPLGVPGADRLQPALLFIPLMTVAGVAAQVIRYRRGTPVERLQLKWVVTTLAAVVAFLVATSLASELGGWTVVPDVGFSLAFAALPVSIGVAVLRYRLYEIDVIIRKTLVYASLVAMLALLYVAGIALLGALLRDVAGQSSALAVTLSTLGVAAAFQPLRTRIQRAVDRRFYRGRYDAADALANLSVRLRESVELEAVRDEVLGMVAATIQPSHTSLWLRVREEHR